MNKVSFSSVGTKFPQLWFKLDHQLSKTRTLQIVTKEEQYSRAYIAEIPKQKGEVRETGNWAINLDLDVADFDALRLMNDDAFIRDC